jgi:hypothetical protein
LNLNFGVLISDEKSRILLDSNMKAKLWLIFLIASVTLGCLVLAQRREIKRQTQLIEELQLQVENGFGAETNHVKRIP